MAAGIEMSDMAGNVNQDGETDWRSRMRKSVPQQYQDSMMDDTFMANLALATEKLNQKRDRQFLRYERLNKIILLTLIVQALLGIWIALWKTFLQPTKIFSGVGDLDDVKMVLMADASRHSGEELRGKSRAVEQQNAITKLSEFLFGHIDLRRASAKQDLEASVQAAQDEENGWLVRTFGSSRPESTVKLRGGYLYLAMGLFNSKIQDERMDVHKFTRNFDKHRSYATQIDNGMYGGTAEYMMAMEHCVEVVKTKKDTPKNYCVIIGDSQAQCKMTPAPEVDDMCLQWPELCPDTGDHGTGSLAESSEEFSKCTTFADTTFKDNGLELIFVFMVPSLAEAQLGLANPTFQDFVATATGCHILNKTTTKNTSMGTRVITEFFSNETCPQFILATTFDEMTAKAQLIAELLDFDTKAFDKPNASKDWRFLCFFLLVLNLVFFLAWGRIINEANRLWVKYQRARGVKKTMVKVSRKMVEKEQPGNSVFADLQQRLSESQLTELSCSREVVKFNTPMVIRCRLKGGYLRRNDGGTVDTIKDDVADSAGTVNDANSEWTFVPADSGLDAQLLKQGVATGQHVRIKNNKGQFLRVTEDRTGFVEGDAEGDPATVFAIEPVEEREDDFNRLGDAITIRPVNGQEGSYLRMTKEGVADGSGSRNQLDVQFSIDRGGPAIRDGLPVQLRSVAADNMKLLGTAEGDLVTAMPGTVEEDDVLANFLIKKVGREGGEGASGSQEDSASVGQPLQARDIVTLTGFNQKLLKAYDGDSRCAVGRYPGTSATSASSTATPAKGGDADDAPGVTKWVIDRVGMATIKGKHDDTLRKGMEVCLKPYRENDDPGDMNKYMKLREEGGFSANGAVTSAEVVFTIDPTNVIDLVTPLTEAMQTGDVELGVASLWDKKNIKKYEANSVPWTNEAELAKLKGHVVVASESGTYTVPKKVGNEEFSWVAVISDKVDLHQAAMKAKEQGASGIIVRTGEGNFLEKLNHFSKLNESPEGPPCLATVFVNKEVGAHLDEKGIVITEGTFKRKHVTEAMRTLGRAGKGTRDPRVIGDVHKAFGKAYLRHLEDVEKHRQKNVKDEVVEDAAADSDDKKFKWKVANTNYIRTNNNIAVKFGKKAPPSAHKRRMTVCKETGKLIEAAADASLQHGHRPAPKKRMTRRETVTVEGGDFARMMLNEDLGEALSEVLTAEDAEAGTLEQLSDESDFRLEYNFEEIQVAVGEQARDLDEDEWLEDKEMSVVKTVGVPMRHFWIMALGLFFSTLFIFLLLRILMKEKAKPVDEDDFEPDADDFWVMPHVANFTRALVDESRGFLAPPWSSQQLRS
mmetsp:Transcript_108163/g.306736  ORF Transcript_108163/g.306736 Transcript_108163/m.306736 type:complete len:1320 (+) Transcript_108163:154-4113(+)